MRASFRRSTPRSPFKGEGSRHELRGNVGPLANIAKLRASEAAFKACDRAVQTFGGMGYAKECNVERYWRESRMSRIAPISNEMILNFVSEHVLGLPRSY